MTAAGLQSAAQVAEGPVPAPAADPWLQELQKRLASADPAERAAAEKQLASVGAIWQQPDLLQKMSEATADLELKNLFLQRAGILRTRTAERDAMNLPPISLNLRNAGFNELADAFNTSLDTDIFRPNPNNNPPGTFNLDAKDKPFWEVFRQLQEQQPFLVQNSGNGLGFYSTQTGIRNFAVSGPAILYPQNITYRRYYNPQSTEPPNVSLNITFNIMVDPRVVVSRITSFSISKAADELGHSLARPGQTASTTAQSNLTGIGLSLQAVEGMGKKLDLECDARIAIQTAAIEAAQDDIQKNLNKDITLGRRTIRISTFTLQPTMINVQANVNQVRTAAAGEDPNALIQYRVLDATGRSIWSFSSPGGFSTSANVAAGSTGPYRLQVSTASKTQDIPVHFDLKDIPLP
jgi:hypothetical protein